MKRRLFIHWLALVAVSFLGIGDRAIAAIQDPKERASWLDEIVAAKRAGKSLESQTQVWHVNAAGNVYARGGTKFVSQDDWHKIAIEGGLAQVSVSPVGRVWGVSKEFDVFFRTGQSATNPYGMAWKKLDGKMKRIVAGLNAVWGIDIDDAFVYRTGITPAVPEGTAWEKIAFEGKAKDISAGVSQVWMVSGAGESCWSEEEPTRSHAGPRQDAQGTTNGSGAEGTA